MGRGPRYRIPISVRVLESHSEHTREHMLRAVYEGVAYNIRWIIERVEKEYKFPLSSLRLIGEGFGASLDANIADVTVRELRRCVMPRKQAR